MSSPQRSHFLAALRVTSLGTLASRVLGLARDMATASLFGLAQGGVLDAFVTAFRLPNLFRRLFGEGALATSFLPEFSRALETDRQSAWRLASVTLFWLTLVLVGMVALAEACCGAAWLACGDRPGVSLLLGLTAVMLPYLILICLAAQLAAMLQALGQFRIPALAPTLLNLCWLGCVLWIAPWWTDARETQAYLLAGAVLAAGACQLGWQWRMLGKLGFRANYDWSGSRESIRRMLANLLPMLVGLAITQLNTACDGLMAWALANPSDDPATISWLGHWVSYPLQQGASAAIYFAERLYRFPLGLVGVSVATVAFPLLSRHAARGDRARLARDLGLGLRLVCFLAIPAGAGLILLAEPVSRLLLARGEFSGDDALRVARLIACYGLGVWAFCALPVLVRGYYALDDRATPLRAGLVALVLNAGLNLVLVWPWAESGLAVATSVSAVAQLGFLLRRIRGHLPQFAWSELWTSVRKTLAATAALHATGYAILVGLSHSRLVNEPWFALARVVAPMMGGIAVFLLASRWLAIPELSLLLVFRGARRRQAGPVA